ncbi:MAG: endonuclease NucS [Nitrososphaerales archaeon]|jgi:hypothetical protein|nr:endonuclease NucS [Nitrososphaerales archaeon]|tara:strand:+ start:1711 stop:2487 length:777 start_codon:yes stop_codon:yes gene_type:complete
MNSPIIASNPSFIESKDILSRAISKHIFIILVADCKIDYVGRSSSKMSWGERVIMLKSDGAVLIHRKTNYKAVNWQPPGANITVSLERGELNIRADRRRPRETLSITCRKIIFISSFLLKDEASFDMLLSEADIYKVLMLYPSLIEPEFRISKQQKELGGGKADITGFDKNGQYTVVEIKRIPADSNSVKQLYRYISNLRTTSPQVRGILLAPNINASAKNLARSLSIEYYSLDLKKIADIYSKKNSSDVERLDKHLF